MMPPSPPTSKASRQKADGRRLTQLLEAAGSDPIMDRTGATRTRDEALVELMWEAALGVLVLGEDESGTTIHAKPDMKMALAILERREGKTPAALPDDTHRLTVADRITELVRASINSEADALGESDREDEMLSEMSEDKIDD